MLREPFMVRALLAAVLLGVMGGAVGVHVILRRAAFVTEALHHTIFPGIALAHVRGLPLLAGALAAAALSVAVLAALRRLAVDHDAALAVTISGFFAAGVAVVSRSSSFQEDLSALLFGRILAVSWSDLAQTGAVVAAGLAVLAAVHKELVMAAFDPAGAAALGLPTRRLEVALHAVTALVVVAGVRAVGTVLVVAFVVTPAVAAGRLTARVGSQMAAAAALGAGAGVAGLVLSYHGSVQLGWRVAPGATMALLVTLAFLVTSAAARLTGRAQPSSGPVAAAGGGATG